MFLFHFFSSLSPSALKTVAEKSLCMMSYFSTHCVVIIWVFLQLFNDFKANIIYISKHQANNLYHSMLYIPCISYKSSFIKYSGYGCWIFRVILILFLFCGGGCFRYFKKNLFRYHVDTMWMELIDFIYRKRFSIELSRSSNTHTTLLSFINENDIVGGF